MMQGNSLVIADGSINNIMVVALFIILMVINFASYMLQMSNCKECLVELSRIKKNFISKYKR